MQQSIAASRPQALVSRIADDPSVRDFVSDRRVICIAAGKASAAAAAAFARLVAEPAGGLVATSSEGLDDVPAPLEGFACGHPLPDEGSISAGRRAIEVASRMRKGERLVVLLSGGASAFLAVPAPGLSLAAKADATRVLLDSGVAIHELNCVRKHLSAIKGGRLAAAAAGPVLTFSLSDVVGPVEGDLSVIGSGPTVADPSTYAQALAIVDRPSMADRFPSPARQTLERGVRGELQETLKPGDARLARSTARLLGSRRDAMDGARRTAEALGYSTRIIEEAVVGEAREAAPRLVHRAVALAEGLSRPACVISTGETTVRVTGGGRGGRNQEFALAAARRLADLQRLAWLVSAGTDGIDGPTDAAGAVVDTTTLRRAAAAGLPPPEEVLENNDAYTYFDRLGDLVRIGPTGTNVGDLQVFLFPR